MTNRERYLKTLRSAKLHRMPLVMAPGGAHILKDTEGESGSDSINSKAFECFISLKTYR